MPNNDITSVLLGTKGQFSPFGPRVGESGVRGPGAGGEMLPRIISFLLSPQRGAFPAKTGRRSEELRGFRTQNISPPAKETIPLLLTHSRIPWKDYFRASFGVSQTLQNQTSLMTVSLSHQRKAPLGLLTPTGQRPGVISATECDDANKSGLCHMPWAGEPLVGIWGAEGRGQFSSSAVE